MFYRLRQSLHQYYFRFRTQRIMRTPPLPCDPGADCTLHTMLSARDVPLYLPAVKSFLRFHPAVAVLVHSDGSLAEKDVALLQAHVPGLRVVLPAEADEKARQALGSETYLFRWRSHDASWRRVIDTELWCRTPKRIIMDADTIVPHRPEEIIAWIRGDSPAFLFGQPPTVDPLTLRPAGRKVIQTVYREKLPGVARRLGSTAEFPQGTTSGFYGCGREHLTLERIEQALRAGEAEGVPMGEWGSEQCTVIYLLASAGARRLSARHYVNYDPGCDALMDEVHAAHFYGTYRYHRHLYTSLAAQVVSDLLASR